MPTLKKARSDSKDSRPRAPANLGKTSQRFFEANCTRDYGKVEKQIRLFIVWIVSGVSIREPLSIQVNFQWLTSFGTLVAVSWLGSKKGAVTLTGVCRAPRDRNFFRERGFHHGSISFPNSTISVGLAGHRRRDGKHLRPSLKQRPIEQRLL